VSSIRLIAAVLLLALSSVACAALSSSTPAPTPSDFNGIADGLTKRAVTITNLVSGDAGCTDPTLIPTAIGFDASGLDQTEPVRIHLYIFNNRASFEKLRESIDVCARSFVTDAETYESAEQSPYVVAGQGPWAPQFEGALRAALQAAAGTGD
jgi:hypothetical protein